MKFSGILCWSLQLGGCIEIYAKHVWHFPHYNKVIQTDRIESAIKSRRNKKVQCLFCHQMKKRDSHITSWMLHSAMFYLLSTKYSSWLTIAVCIECKKCRRVLSSNLSSGQHIKRIEEIKRTQSIVFISLSTNRSALWAMNIKEMSIPNRMNPVSVLW